MSALSWSKRLSVWRLRRERKTVALVVPVGQQWSVIGYLRSRTVHPANGERFAVPEGGKARAEAWAMENGL
jgi:hypothetical protein